MNTLFVSLLLAAAPQDSPAAAATRPTAATSRPASLDLARIERKIVKEPKYVAEPRYALFLLDETGAARHWFVLDKSKADGEWYDVLYLDLNGNGDLTEPDERFTTTYNEKGAPAGIAVAFRLREIAVPGTKLVHKDLLLSTSPKANRTGAWFRLKWNGAVEMSGGYGLTGTSTTEYGESPEKAPILWPNPDRPLSFALWEDGEVKLPIGGKKKLNFIVGSPGFGPRSLCVVDEDFLDLGEDKLVATVIARDANGKEVRTRNEIKEHC